MLVPRISVAGEGLRKVLENGVTFEMDKAMMLLVQKSSSGAVDRARAGPSRPSHSVSIELLDDHIEKPIEEPEKVACDEEGNELVLRKRPREDTEQQGPSTRRVLNKTLTIVEGKGLATPSPEGRAGNDIIGVEIRPHERWTCGSTVPLRALRMFHLPQDNCSYVGRVYASVFSFFK